MDIKPFSGILGDLLIRIFFRNSLLPINHLTLFPHLQYLHCIAFGLEVCVHRGTALTRSLLMSYIYMELLVKPDILTSYIYGPKSGNAESRLFLFVAQCFNIKSMQKVILCHSCV
jgi:hypothetical protein